MKIFIICGYGVPPDIKNDDNYRTYLHMALNKIYEMAKNSAAAIIACGGPTNCEPPYEGTEAAAIADYLRELVNRPEMSKSTQDWQIIEESESLSTLENLLNAQKIIQDRQFDGEITIFCEKTREHRLNVIAEQVFHDQKHEISAIDFDISSNRYLEPELINKKEERCLTETLWALEDPERVERLHRFFEGKFEFLRQKQREGLSHTEAVEAWYRSGDEEIRRLMPDHPLLSKKS